MVVFNLGPLGRLAIGRGHPLRTAVPPSDNKLPPPYSESSSPFPPQSREKYYNGPSYARKPNSPKDQLRPYLIEIVAFSLDANFNELISALYSRATTTQTTSILCEEERKQLLHLSQQVQKLREKARRNQTNTMLRAEKMELYKAIYRPAETLRVPRRARTGPYRHLCEYRA